jgi:hypothetical protein
MDAFAIAINQAIEAFSNKFEMEQEILDNLKDLLMEAGKRNMASGVSAAAAAPKRKTRATASAAPKAKRQHRMNGYNMYIKQKFRDAKSDGSMHQDGSLRPGLMGEISKAWKDMSDEDKQTYKDMADEFNASQATASGSDGDGPVDSADDAAAAAPKAKAKAKAKGTKKLNGYNLFYREMRDEIKAGLEEGEKLMAKVGQVWKELTDAERDDYKERAAALSE